MTINVVGFTPYESQKEWIETIENPEVKYVTITTGRQVGKSLFGLNMLLKWGLETPNQMIMFVSPIYSQARKVFEDLERAVGNGNLIKSKNKSNYDVEFINGTKIMFRSAERPDGLRGYTLDYLVVDEAAFISDNVWDTILKPTILVKGKKCLFTSTPKGRNWFYKLHLRGVDEDQSTYRSIRAKTSDNPYIDKEEIDESRRTLPEDIYKQEILGEFVDDGGSVFKNLDTYCILDTWGVKLPGVRYYGGIDFGRAEDYTVLTILNDRGQVVYVYRERQKPWEVILNEMVTIMKKYDAQVQLEINSIGDVLFESLKKLYKKVTPFLTTNASKQHIIEDLIYSLNQGDLYLPSQELFPPLYSELGSFSYKYSPSSRKVIYGGLTGTHDDTVMSLGIAYNTLKSKKSSGSYFLK